MAEKTAVWGVRFCFPRTIYSGVALNEPRPSIGPKKKYQRLDGLLDLSLIVCDKLKKFVFYGHVHLILFSYTVNQMDLMKFF